MKEITDSKHTVEGARRQFIVSLVLVALAVAYLISPIDFIPDFLFPVGYLDDIPVLIASAVYSWYSYRKMKKGQDREHA